MFGEKRSALWLAALLLAAVLLAGTIHAGSRPAAAQTSPGYNLEWHAIGGGGQASSSTSYVVNGTIGQAVASQPYVTSSHYAVSGGYWFASVYRLYAPVIMKNYP